MNTHQVSQDRLYFLWHPGTQDVFSGYGLTVQPGRIEHLVGLLMVDRPQRVDPDWLTEVTAQFGGYELYAMTITQERGIACQMWVTVESRKYLRQFGVAQEFLGQVLTQALTPLVQELPRPRLAVRWNESLRLWTSEFYQPTDSEETGG